MCNILSYISSQKAAKSGINYQNYMLKQQRQAHILHQVNLHNQVLSTGLSLEDIRTMLQQVNVDSPKGSISGGHVPAHAPVQVT